jgi:hypothetical protein
MRRHGISIICHLQKALFQIKMSGLTQQPLKIGIGLLHISEGLAQKQRIVTGFPDLIPAMLRSSQILSQLLQLQGCILRQQSQGIQIHTAILLQFCPDQLPLLRSPQPGLP